MQTECAATVSDLKGSYDVPAHDDTLVPKPDMQGEDDAIFLQANARKRFLASTADSVVQVVIALAAGMGATLAMAYSGMEIPDWLPTVSTSVGCVLYVLANAWLLQSQGQTLGKRLLGIRILMVSGERASLGRLLCRELLFFLPHLFLGAAWELFQTALFLQSSRMFHDRVTGTMVVSDVI